MNTTMTEQTHHDLMTERAFAIADEAMRERVASNSIPIDGVGLVWKPCNVAGLPVANFGDADPEVIGAVEWLVDRGLAQLHEPVGGCMISMNGD